MQTIEALRAAIPQLPNKDVDFAQSLITQYDRKGRLSDAQLAWVERLVARANAPKPGPVGRVDLFKLQQLFNAASANTKSPKVRFATEDGDHFIVTQAPLHGRNAGCLYIKSDGTYLGKIDAHGDYSASRDIEASLASGVLGALRTFAADPAAAAKAYGMRFSNCCFCALELTNAQSLMAGYGPICAENYGLPIPSKKEALAWLRAQAALDEAKEEAA